MTNESIMQQLNWTYDSDPGRFQLFNELISPALDLARADEREGKWVKITDEDSLPKDDDALCLFAEWVNGTMAISWLTRCKEAKQEPNIEAYTHYTIITPPNQ